MSLAALLDAGPDIFYGDQRSVYYSTGWLLVHFLRHGEEGWGDDLFPELLLYAVEGYSLRASGKKASSTSGDHFGARARCGGLADSLAHAAAAPPNRAVSATANT